MFPKVATVITLSMEANGVAEADLIQACILHAKELCARLRAEQDSLGLDSEAAAYILDQLPAC